MSSNLTQKCSHSYLNVLSISNVELILSLKLSITNFYSGKLANMDSSLKMQDSKNLLRGLKVNNMNKIYH